MSRKEVTISPQTAKAILAKRQAKIITPASILDPVFPKQNEFILAPEKLKALWCTRRSAKSFTAGLYLVYEALSTPGCNCLFIGKTRESAHGAVWKDVLKAINYRYKLKAKFNEASLTMTLQNGSVIKVTGVDASSDSMTKLLGRKFKLVCIDEASVYQVDLRRLCYDILGPAMSDQDGTICLMGTASNFKRGLFYDVTLGKEQGWRLFGWTAHDNPYMAKQWAKTLNDIATLRPAYKETPQYRQWYENKWETDDTKTVYKFNEARNVYEDLPAGLSTNGWTYILGVDTGWTDDNAFVLTAYHTNDPHLYVVSTFNKPEMTFDQVVNKINEYMGDKDHAPVKVIIDGANRQGIETMRSRSSIPFEFAEKLAKFDFIEMMNGDFVQSIIKINSKSSALIDELMGLVYKTDASDKIVIPRREHPSLSNHLCDALLYAWRNGFHYQSDSADKLIPMYSKEWFAHQAEGIWEREREHLERQEQGDPLTIWSS